MSEFNHQCAGYSARKLFFYTIMTLLLFVSTIANEVFAGDRNYYEPRQGTSERREIMNVARIPISTEIGSQVIFMVDILRTDGHMAYLQATPVNPDSSPLNWNNTPFSRDWKNDMMSDVVMVLLEKRNGRWNVRDYVIGPTDVHWYGWLGKYNLPEKLFFGG